MIDIENYINNTIGSADASDIINMLYDMTTHNGEAKTYNDAVFGADVKDGIVKMALLIRGMINAVLGDIDEISEDADYIAALKSVLSDEEAERLDAILSQLSDEDIVMLDNMVDWLYRQNVYTTNAYIQGGCYVSNGSYFPSSVHCVTDFIPADEFYGYVKPVGVNCVIHYYDTKNHQLSARVSDADTDETFFRSAINFSTGTKWIRVTVKKIVDGDEVEITPSDIFSTGFRLLLFDSNSRKYAIDCALECGALRDDYGTISATRNFYEYRRTEKMVRINGDVWIEFDKKDIPHTTGFSVWGYADGINGISFIGKTLGNNPAGYFYEKGDADYIKIVLSVVPGSENHVFAPIKISSAKSVSVVYNPVITTLSHGVVEFNYEVADGVFTRGQIMLPPNYSVDGKAVPLHVYCHGTGGMEKWETPIYEMVNWNGTAWATNDFSGMLEYETGEGFAVFNCYPWTSKHYANKRQISPFLLAIQERAYIEGIKYVCSRFNVDINAVCVSGFSLGGNMAAFLARQTEIPVRAVAMMAPTNGYASLRWREYFIEQNARELIADILGLENATAFIETTYGLTDPTVRAYVADNISAFVGQNISAIGVFGASWADMDRWADTGTTELPEWMANFPAIPAAWAYGIPQYVNHPELSAYINVPIKYWQAFDDENTSAHSNYTVFTWLLNGGSKAYWRTLENGTGGHGATGYSNLCEKEDVTTRLGIECEDVPVAAHEMIEFFYDNI